MSRTPIFFAALTLAVAGTLVGMRPARPDLQGTWTNATVTPLERLPGAAGLTLTDEEVAAIERAEPRPSGDQLFRETGPGVLRIDGAPRSSILVDPPDGRIPPRTPAGAARLAALAGRRAGFGEFDHPELRPLGERCVVSFGSNAGPPMLPNYFHNNNYTIVQTDDHVVILSEMIHDARIIPIGRTPAPAPGPPRWFGQSVGRWDRDTLVVETTNLHPAQLEQTDTLWAYRGASPGLRVTERLTPAGANAIRYRFTIEDPATFTAPFSGELIFSRIDERVYEYACHEANYSLTNILTVARSADAPAPPRPSR